MGRGSAFSSRAVEETWEGKRGRRSPDSPSRWGVGGAGEGLGPGAVFGAEWEIERCRVVDRSLVTRALIDRGEDRRKVERDIRVRGLEGDRDRRQGIADRPSVSI